MKKTYTKRQIEESIKHWQKFLKENFAEDITIEDFCNKRGYSEDIYNKVLDKIAEKLSEDILVQVDGREEREEFEYDDIYFISNVTGGCIHHRGNFSSRAEDPEEYYGYYEGGEVDTSIDEKALDAVGLKVDDLTNYDDYEYESSYGSEEARFTLQLRFEVKISDEAKLLAFLGDTVPVAEKEEMIFGDEALEKRTKLKESESAFDNVEGLTGYYARDLIFEDAPKTVEVREVPYTSKFFKRTLQDLELLPEDQAKVEKIYLKNEQYRIFVYFLNGVADYKWSDAKDNIDTQLDFDEYIDRSSSMWQYDQDDFDNIVPQFTKEFPTYDKWITYLGENAKKQLLEKLHEEELPYSSIESDDIKVNKFGTAYALIVWRA